jgi:DNA-binding NtrC family response regulator
MIRLSHLPSPAFGAGLDRKAEQQPGHEGGITLRPGQPLTRIDEAYITLTLEHVQGNRKRAAGLLGISLRTLQDRIATLRKEAKPATCGD